MKKPVIAFVTGGYSSESVISYQSAVTIENNIDRELFDVYRIDITPTKWFHPSKDGKEFEIDKNDFSFVHQGSKVIFDAVLIGIHGTPGEDGKLQGYFDLMGLPYTSCDAATSAITFNKRYTCAIAGASGFSVSRSFLLYKNMNDELLHTLMQMNFPLFVKPNNGGSSIGISKVNRKEDLTMAIEKAFKEDSQVLVEEYIKGREFTVGVYRTFDEVKTLPITEIISQNDFFDFEAKYKGKSSEITPAKCEEEVSIKIRNAAIGIYKLFNCNGVVRMDFIYSDKENVPFLLEINTVPGQSSASIVPQQVAAAGMELKHFYTMLINNSLAHKTK